jgi:hypothetical protein
MFVNTADFKHEPKGCFRDLKVETNFFLETGGGGVGGTELLRPCKGALSTSSLDKNVHIGIRIILRRVKHGISPSSAKC